MTLHKPRHVMCRVASFCCSNVLQKESKCQYLNFYAVGGGGERALQVRHTKSGGGGRFRSDIRKVGGGGGGRALQVRYTKKWGGGGAGASGPIYEKWRGERFRSDIRKVGGGGGGHSASGPIPLGTQKISTCT